MCGWHSPAACPAAFKILLSFFGAYAGQLRMGGMAHDSGECACRAAKRGLSERKIAPVRGAGPYGQDAESWNGGNEPACSVQRGYEKDGGIASAEFSERKGDLS